MNPNDVIAGLRRRLEEAPEDPYLLLNLAAHMRRAGRVAESSELYLRCHEVYQTLGKAQKAHGCLLQLLRFDPGNLRATLLLATTLATDVRDRRRPVKDLPIE